MCGATIYATDIHVARPCLICVLFYRYLLLNVRDFNSSLRNKGTRVGKQRGPIFCFTTLCCNYRASLMNVSNLGRAAMWYNNICNAHSCCYVMPYLNAIFPPSTQFLWLQCRGNFSLRDKGARVGKQNGSQLCFTTLCSVCCKYTAE